MSPHEKFRRGEKHFQIHQDNKKVIPQPDSGIECDAQQKKLEPIELIAK